jgi:hypothetical protein
VRPSGEASCWRGGTGVLRLRCLWRRRRTARGVDAVRAAAAWCGIVAYPRDSMTGKSPLCNLRTNPLHSTSSLSSSPTMAFCLRFARTLCAPLAAIVAFSCLLTFVFILYQPTPGPGIKMRLGWQSWETISDDLSQSPQSPPPPSDHHDGVDWWDITNTSSPNVDSASLPLDEWAPTLPHDTGRTYYLPLLLLHSLHGLYSVRINH